MLKDILLTLVVTSCCCMGVDVQGGVKSYQGYSVIRLAVDSEGHHDLMNTCGCKGLEEAVWLCDKNATEKVEQSALKRVITIEYVTRNLGKDIDEEARTSNERKTKFKHQRYLGSQSMYEWIEKLAQMTKNIKFEKIGLTGEGRDIKMVKINSDDLSLPTVFIDAGMHAREWISPAATLYLIESLARAIDKGSRSLKSFQWHIVPLANPDGYEYSRTKDRMWRKNTVDNPGSECKGVDLNRNFAQGYGIGASKNPCSEVYKGTKPFSENESTAIRDYITNTSNIQAAVSVHSYGNVLIYPWGYLKNQQHPRRKQLKSLAKIIRKSILKKTREKYEIGTATEVFGAWGFAGGCTDDWYITQNISYSYTFELPGSDGKGDHGFLLPARNIKRVGKQLREGFLALARGLKKRLRDP